MTIYRGVGGVNREIKQHFRGVGGVNREIKEQYRGVGGVNRKVFSKEPQFLIPTMTSMANEVGTITAGVTTQAIYGSRILADYPYSFTQQNYSGPAEGSWCCVAINGTNHSSNTQSMAWWGFIFTNPKVLTKIMFDEKRFCESSLPISGYTYSLYLTNDGTNYYLQETKRFSLTSNNSPKYNYWSVDSTFFNFPTTAVKGFKLACSTVTANTWPSTAYMCPSNLRVYGI